MKSDPRAIRILTAREEWTVAQLSDLWHIKAQMVRLLLKPYRVRCRRRRIGRNYALALFVPVDVVLEIDRERRADARPGIVSSPKTTDNTHL